MTTLNDIAGYMTSRSVWAMLRKLSVVCQENTFDISLSPASILFDNDDIVVERSADADAGFLPCDSCGEASVVWTIGALAFYALMGVRVFDGQGGANQTAATTVPRIGAAHCDNELGDLLFRCLSFDPLARPSLSGIVAAADNALQKPAIPRKTLSNAQGMAYKTSLVKFWPDEIVTLVLAVCLALSPVISLAQTQKGVTDEMKTLVRRCKDMRTPKNSQKVSRELLYDMQWTLMDEIEIDRKGECTSKDAVDMFGINDIGYYAMKKHGGVANAGGRFRNGQDARYKYSFIEITVKKGAVVNYDITGRQGEQLFAIVPFADDAAFTASLTKAGTPFSKSFDADGTRYVRSSAAVKKSDRFRLSIKNNSGRNMAFVILNYNPGK